MDIIFTVFIMAQTQKFWNYFNFLFISFDNTLLFF